MTSRRQYLTLVPATFLSGCLTSKTESLPPLGEIEIQNLLSRPVTANLGIEKENEKRYTEEFRLHAFNDGNGTAGEQPDRVSAITVQEPWMGDPVNYRIILEVPGVGTDTYSSREFDEMFEGDDCWGVAYDLDYDRDGNEAFERYASGTIEGAVECP